MAAGEYDKKNETGKGFAGLSSLLSDVDVTPPPAVKNMATSSTGSTSGVSRPAPPPAPPRQQPVPQQPYKPSQQPGPGSSSGKWWIGIVAVIGMLWLFGQFNKNTSSPTSAYSPPAQSTTPRYSAPPLQPQIRSSVATSTDTDLISDGDGATYRVPSFRVAELDASKRVAESAQLRAREVDVQVERQKNILGDEKRQVDEAKGQLDALGNEIEQQRLLVDSSSQYEVDSFNLKIRKYNTNKTQLRNQINKFNIDVDISSSGALAKSTRTK